MAMTSPSSPSALSGLWLPHQTPPAGAAPLSDLPLTILVGVTGVGKSTALSALTGTSLRVLPDRREVTDAVMIEPLAGRAVTDRQERFALSARYRQTHPGGMAQALGTLRALPKAGERLVFDGLRGLNEVRYAAERCATWRFIHLHAPDALRVRRLLGRGDAFDAVNQGAASRDLSSELAALSGAAQVFTTHELGSLAALAQQGHTPADILAKTKIVLSERQNYDPVTAHAFLLMLPTERTLDLDTAALLPGEVARQVEAWL